MPATWKTRAAIAAVLLASHAAADEPALENVVVTGTRIARSDFESPSPLVTVPAETFGQTGSISVERTLESYPQFVAAATATSNEPSSDGQATVSLRGLGATRSPSGLDYWRS